MFQGVVNIDKVHGNIEGLKEYYINRLGLLYDFRFEREETVNPDLAYELCFISGKINREVAIYINRRGQVVDVLVGDIGTVSLEAVEGRKGHNRLSGIRCIHTHPGGTGILSSVDITAMKLLKLDAMIAIGVRDDQPNDIYIGYIRADNKEAKKDYIVEGPFSILEVNHKNIMSTILGIEKILSEKSTLTETGSVEEKAILVGLQLRHKNITESIKELAQLAETAGVKVLGQVVQQRDKPDNAYFIGLGKAKELNLLRQSNEANVIIFDDELTPAQLRNLEQQIGAKVIDRTALILDIFAQRARTKEGKLQVELAQLNYLLPRLTGQGIALSRLGGGIGTRGPGETKLEVDRRRIRKRISELEKDITQVQKTRALQRKNRKSVPLPVAALVGYTNAGKSTLLNKLTNSDVLAEDKLFATLDPTTRKVILPNKQMILLTDTVGFIKKLPHHLVAAFRATLEEVIEADLLIHVVDGSHLYYHEQMVAVMEVLNQLKVLDKPIITVFNKIDQIAQEEILPTEVPFKLYTFISAQKGIGINNLLTMMAENIPGKSMQVNFKIPYSDSKAVALLHSEGKVINEKFDFDYTYMTADVNEDIMAKLERYVTGSGINGDK